MDFRPHQQPEATRPSGRPRVRWRPRERWRPGVLIARLAGIAAALWLLACWGVLMGGERRFTYQPDPTRTPPEAARLVGVVEREIVTPDGERLVGWQARAKPGKPTLLYFHGNGAALTYRSGRIAAFQSEGWGVLMVAYRGYSGSTGWPSEAAIVRDARLVYDTLIGDGVPASDIIIYGESLGTSVAVQTAVVRPSRAVILEAPFTSMVDAWRQFAPLLPVGTLLRDRFDTLAVIRNIKAPLLIMHGRRDRLVAFGLGLRLYEAAPEPKRFAEFPEAGHTNLYDYNAIGAVRPFVEEVMAGRMAGN